MRPRRIPETAVRVHSLTASRNANRAAYRRCKRDPRHAGNTPFVSSSPVPFPARRSLNGGQIGGFVAVDVEFQDGDRPRVGSERRWRAAKFPLGTEAHRPPHAEATPLQICVGTGCHSRRQDDTPRFVGILVEKYRVFRVDRNALDGCQLFACFHDALPFYGTVQVGQPGRLGMQPSLGSGGRPRLLRRTLAERLGSPQFPQIKATRIVYSETVALSTFSSK
jgi:hypothetical protein